MRLEKVSPLEQSIASLQAGGIGDEDISSMKGQEKEKKKAEALLKRIAAWKRGGSQKSLRKNGKRALRVVATHGRRHSKSIC